MTAKPFAIGDRVVTTDSPMLLREYRNRAGVVVDAPDSAEVQLALFATPTKHAHFIWALPGELRHDR